MFWCKFVVVNGTFFVWEMIKKDHHQYKPPILPNFTGIKCSGAAVVKRSHINCHKGGIMARRGPNLDASTG